MDVYDRPIERAKHFNHVTGVGPDEPTTTNDLGGMETASPYRCDLLPGKATLEIAKVLKQGTDKYQPDNWRLIPFESHINHALQHIFAHQAGDTQDNHIAHAACRMLFALELLDETS